MYHEMLRKVSPLASLGRKAHHGYSGGYLDVSQKERASPWLTNYKKLVNHNILRVLQRLP